MDVAMEFEMTMRLVLGEKAYHVADSQGSAGGRREWLTKVLRELMNDIDALDTTARHKQMLMGELEAISALLNRDENPSWSLVYRFLRLASRLLGYDYVRGAKCHSLAYWQTSGQNLNTVVFEGGDVMQDCYNKKNAIAVRRSVVDSLKAQGLNDYKIALVLNTTEYQVKKLRKEAPDA